MRISDWSSDVCSSDLRATRQVDDLGRLRLDLRIALVIGEANQSVGVGHVQIIAHQRHAERRVEVFQKKIGRASCRERVCQYVWISVVAGQLKTKTNSSKKQRYTNSENQ